MARLLIPLFLAAALPAIFGGTTNHFLNTGSLQQPLAAVPKSSQKLKDISYPCDAMVSECLDEESYPNIAQGFRGYNPILGDPLDAAGDQGYEAPIFDEAVERDGEVRFGNTAGSDLNRCDISVEADFLENVEEFFSSVTQTEGEQSGFHVGPEMNVAVGGSGKGVSGAVSTTIPPLLQSIGSNSAVMKDVARGLVSNNRKVTRSRFNCYEYDFEIKDAHHPEFTPQFKVAVKKLTDCLKAAPTNKIVDYSERTAATDECVRQFFQNYGTHYVKEAVFGSKMSILTVLEGKVLETSSSQTLQKCATESSKWSFLGLFGGGSASQTCKDSVFGDNSKVSNLKSSERILTVGSRPKGSYVEWAAQTGNPEIVKKTIAPISDLFTKDFINNVKFQHPNTISASDVALMRPLLESYVNGYCELFPTQCNFVVSRGYSAVAGNPNQFEPCNIEESACALYTGPVDTQFLPHGDGSLFVNGVENKIHFVHGLAQVTPTPGHGAKVTQIITKTSNVAEAECDDCAISAEICDSIGNCCKTGSLDNKHDNLMRGAQDIFARDMDQCSSTILDPEHQLTLTIKHTGEDGWTGEWVRVMLDNGMYKHCPMYDQFLDDTSEAVLTCY